MIKTFNIIIVTMFIFVGCKNKHPGASRPKISANIIVSKKFYNPDYYRIFQCDDEFAVIIAMVDTDSDVQRQSPPVVLWNNGVDEKILSSFDIVKVNAPDSRFHGAADLTPMGGPHHVYKDFQMSMLTGEIASERRRRLGGENTMIPDRLVEEHQISYKGTFIVTYKGKVLVEQDFNSVDFMTAHTKAYVLYGGEYLLFKDYPYYEKDEGGRPFYRYYLLKVPKEAEPKGDGAEDEQDEGRPKGRPNRSSLVRLKDRKR